MSRRNKTIETLRGLLAERQQYEQWLVALANKRADTPQKVYERVHADYQTRLNSVVERLQSHTADLQNTMSELSAQLTDVTSRESTRKDVQQEAELRAAVGEYTPEQWSEMKSAADSELRKIASEKSVIESQLSELTEIVALSQGRSIPVAIPAQRMPPPAPKPSGQESGRPIQVAPAPPPAPGAAPVAPTPLPAAPNTKRAEADLGSEKSKVPFPNWDKSGEQQVAAVSKQSKTAPVKPEKVKTLKCQQCGVMNYPTEWYCEKCGGELAEL